MALSKIRVLIVEDTLVGQGLLKGLLAEDPRFEVIGIVGNGRQAIDFISINKPDVVSMDIYMPVMDGVEATTIIMQQTPVPIAIVSSFYNTSEVQMSFKILEAGALTILPRPYGPGHSQFAITARNYRNTLKMLSEIKVSALKVRIKSRYNGSGGIYFSNQTNISDDKTSSRENKSENYEIIAIGASAGGPQAIHAILKEIPESLRVPVMIVQHIDKNFADGYCDWLNSVSNIPIHIARNNETMLPGHGYLPPGDNHLGLIRQGVIGLSKNPPEKGLRPAVSFLFRDILTFYGNKAVAILLSGMGADGAPEIKKLRDAGALTIAQDAETSLVHGMPGEAIRLGGAAKIQSPEEIVVEITRLFTI
ncbi:MAG: chemotaxis protein CheB [Bacteroidota bacterium]